MKGLILIILDSFDASLSDQSEYLDPVIIRVSNENIAAAVDAHL